MLFAGDNASPASASGADDTMSDMTAASPAGNSALVPVMSADSKQSASRDDLVVCECVGSVRSATGNRDRGQLVETLCLLGITQKERGTSCICWAIIFLTISISFSPLAGHTA